MLRSIGIDLSHDLRYGLRALRKKPGFTIVALLTLSLSIGANSAIFTLVNNVLLRRLPYEQPEKLVSIWMKRVDRDKAPFSIPDFLDLRNRNQHLAHTCGYAGWGATMTGEFDAERLDGMRVSGDFFEMLDVRPLIGQAIEPADDEAAAPRVVVLSHRLWTQRFGGDKSLIGKTLVLNGNSYGIKGVLPASFVFPGFNPDLFIPLSPATDPFRTERGTNSLRIIGRLKPNATQNQAQEDLNSIVTQLRQEYPKTNTGKMATTIIPLHTELVSDFSLAMWLLFLAVGSVLLIACSNLASLLLVQATSRQREAAIRMSIGAERWRLIRQFLTESLIIGLTGGVVGVLLALWFTKALKSFAPATLPRQPEIVIDWRVLLFTLGVSVTAGIIFGLAPALQTSNVNLTKQLNTEGRGSSEGSGKKTFRDLLVVMQVCASLVLVVGAGLFIKSFLKLQAIDPGFQIDNALTLQLPLPRERFNRNEPLVSFITQLSTELKQIPGVVSTSFGTILPVTGQFARCNFTLAKRPPARPEETPVAQYRGVGLDYFRTMRIPLLRGREFTTFDTRQSRPVMIINQTVADKLFPNENPVGEYLTVYDSGQTGRAIEIVGVVGNVPQVNLEDEPTYDLYTSLHQAPDDTVVWLMSTNLNLVVRTNSNPMAIKQAVLSAIRRVDRSVPVRNVRTFEELVSSSSSLSTRRFHTSLLLIFAGFALLLAALGIFGIISNSVTLRTREIGIRMALGASQSEIFRMILLSTLKLVSIGVVAGLLGAFVLSQLISSLLFRVAARDPTTFVASVILLTLVALGASVWPARRATKVDPIVALNQE